MPDFNHPPYGTSTLQPRVLNRWLDVNSQNGPLGRFQTFIVIPSFTPIAQTWRGYSDLVGTINYASPNNFSFKNLPKSYLQGLNFLLCIAFLDNNDNVVRYSLNSGIGETIYFSLELYTNQPILNNFRLEIWSIGNGNPVNTTASPALYTSVLGDKDYRYGLDTNLTGNQLINELFNTANLNLPFLFPATSYFVPQGTPLIVGSTPLPASGSPLSVIPIVDTKTGTIMYLRVTDETVVISPN